mmetsp:Transcript_13857/g.41887  ORF Transcript_13857/g.41887 Transcript_13857/m.41887 type:complete len:206 (+) Transcript_13857:1503-2120(+)
MRRGSPTPGSTPKLRAIAAVLFIIVALLVRILVRILIRVLWMRLVHGNTSPCLLCLRLIRARAATPLRRERLPWSARHLLCGSLVVVRCRARAPVRAIGALQIPTAVRTSFPGVQKAVALALALALAGRVGSSTRDRTGDYVPEALSHVRWRSRVPGGSDRRCAPLGRRVLVGSRVFRILLRSRRPGAPALRGWRRKPLNHSVHI